MFSGLRASPPGNEVLERLLVCVDWGRPRTRLEGLSTWGGPRREPVDPVMLFKLLLFERLYQLSDGQAVWLAKELLSFVLFQGLGTDGAAPDDIRYRSCSGNGDCQAEACHYGQVEDRVGAGDWAGTGIPVSWDQEASADSDGVRTRSHDGSRRRKRSRRALVRKRQTCRSLLGLFLGLIFVQLF